MKKITLILAFLFASIVAFAQSGNITSKQVDTVSVQTTATAVSRTSTTTTLQAYSGTATTVIVVATDGTGGTFTYSTSALTADGGTIFAATGKGSGFWVRQYNPADGIKVVWFGDNQAGMAKAITLAGTNGKVVFTPNKTYSQTDQLVPLSGQIWVGNNATIQRQTESIVTITSTVSSSATSFTVSSVPSTWVAGVSYIQIFPGQGSTGASPLVQIQSIVGNTITLYGAIGAGLYNSATSYASGSSVWRVWTQVVNPSHVNHEIDNLNFDGNSSTSVANDYWGGNIALYSAAPAVRIIGCNFINMGADCIEGQGLYVTGCTYNNLNNSFIHLTADFTVSPALYPSEIFDNKGTNSNQIESAGTNGSQHSEGVITFSYTSGYSFIHDNWFKGGLDSFVGTIAMGAVTQSGATRFMRIHDNQVFNQAGIIYGFSANNTELIKPGEIIFDDNQFDNCGTTTPFPATLSATWAYIDKIVWFNNILSGGTTITIPAEVFTTDAIANVGSTANIQTNTSYNIDGNGTLGGNLSVAGTSTFTGTGSFTNNATVGGTFAVTGTSSFTGNLNVGGSLNTTESLGLHKNITGGTGAYAIYNDGAIQSGVTSSAYMNYSRPSTQATSFTLSTLTHYYAYGFTLGSGSAVTTQIGFEAESAMTGATNNYGFYGNLAANTGVYNFYAPGTGQNWFNGKTGFGSGVSTPTGEVTIGAGTATLAPIVITSGTDLTTAAAGSFEFNGTRLAFSPSTTRKRVPLYTDATPTSNYILVGNGTDFTLTAPTGTGSPVEAASPTLSGTPLSTTAAQNTNTTQIATTAFTEANVLTRRTLTAVNSSATLTAAQMQSGVVTTSTTAVAFTTATAAQLYTQFGSPAQGSSFLFVIDNTASTSSGAITITLGTGITSGVTPGLTVAIGKSQTYIVTFTSSTAAVMGQLL